MRIGIDVGGTNTDAVIMDGRSIVAHAKRPTTPDISGGIVSVLETVLREAKVAPSAIQAVMIGTTHFTNAVVERKRLLSVGIIRLALPATKCLPPMCDWPQDLSSALGRHRYLVRGGHNFDGRVIAPLDETAISEAARDIKKKGLKTAAITSVFSPVNQDMEDRAAEILLQEIPDIAITLSHQIGRIGFLERENATVMNACLAELARSVVGSFRTALAELKIEAPFYVSQNDGTLMTSDYVEKYPVLTFASGPTNSMRGAVFLAGLKDAMVVDIGGTTSDIGMLIKGFPRESSVAVDIGGVRTNFRMPDVLAIGLGGGSIVRDEGTRVGPDSVGFRLTEESLVFGGQTLTATDIAVAAGHADVGDAKKVAHLNSRLVDAALDRMHDMIDTAVDRMRTSAEPLQISLVRGGANLIARNLPSASVVNKPDYAPVANAIGAAIAQVGGEVERMFSLDAISRDEALDQAKQEAVTKTIAAGAREESVSVVDIEEILISYLPGNATRIRVKAAGDLAIS